MKISRKVAFAVCLLSLLGAAAFAAEEGRFFTYPTIHNDKIVFTYESDLWSVSAKGGVASRLTTFPGTESFAKLSPDGKWVAFTAPTTAPRPPTSCPPMAGPPSA